MTHRGPFQPRPFYDVTNYGRLAELGSFWTAELRGFKEGSSWYL